MGRTTFRPEIDGFAFENSWTFDALETEQLKRIISEALPAAEAIASPIIAAIAGPVIATELAIAGPFAPIVLYYEIKAINDAATNAIVNAVDAKPYGLCGGMAFAALDYWLQGWIVPRGTGPHDQPSRDTQQGTELRNYIWSRLVDSIEAHAVTFLSWMITLQIPLLGGAQWLKDRSAEQFQTIKHTIDASGQPVPIGLIGTTLNPMDNHQVLCYGYDDPGDGTGSLILYDNNRP